MQEVDISGLTVHPACVVSVLLTSLRTESWRIHNTQHTPLPAQSVIINISGKVLMIQRDQRSDVENSNGKLVGKNLLMVNSLNSGEKFHEDDMESNCGMHFFFMDLENALFRQKENVCIRMNKFWRMSHE